MWSVDGAAGAQRLDFRRGFARTRPLSLSRQRKGEKRPGRRGCPSRFPGMLLASGAATECRRRRFSRGGWRPSAMLGAPHTGYTAGWATGGALNWRLLIQASRRLLRWRFTICFFPAPRGANKQPRRARVKRHDRGCGVFTHPWRCIWFPPCHDVLAVWRIGPLSCVLSVGRSDNVLFVTIPGVFA